MVFSRSTPLLVRFWGRVDKGPGCWLWTGFALYQGYGVLRFRGKKARAHRVAWMLTNGDIPEGMFVCHRCDTPACVRPDHLFLGTREENVADMVAKGRQFLGRRKHATPNAKVNADDVVRIRSLPAPVDVRGVALQYGVRVVTIRRILKRATWLHVA